MSLSMKSEVAQLKAEMAALRKEVEYWSLVTGAVRRSQSYDYDRINALERPYWKRIANWLGWQSPAVVEWDWYAFKDIYQRERAGQWVYRPLSPQ